MSTDSTATEVFEDVEPDPDAILEAHGAETPDELIESGGKHDAGSDDAVDTTAAELFADLADVETADSNPQESADPIPQETESDKPSRTDGDGDGADPAADLAFEFVGDSDVTVRDDGAVIDATAAELGALTATDPSPGRATDASPVWATDSVERTEPTASASPDSAGAADEPSGTLTIRDDGTDDLELVGPDPTPTRLADDTFDAVPADDR